jgi:hypothetical protein
MKGVLLPILVGGILCAALVYVAMRETGQIKSGE